METDTLTTPEVPKIRRFRVEQQNFLDAARVDALKISKGCPFPLLAGGVLGDVVEVEERVYVAEEGSLFDNWTRLGRWCSTVRGGFFHCRRDGLSWSNGSQGSVLLSSAGYTEMCRAREILERYRPEKATGSKIRTTQGVCRELLMRLHDMEVAKPYIQDMGREHSHLIENERWCYIRVVPGDYPDCTMWDASGYYYELARRIPTPEVQCRPNRAPSFGPAKSDLARGWKELVSLIGGYKSLRNTLIGCMGAGTREKKAWHKGKETTMPTRFNFFTPAGFLVVRMGYEITQQCAIHHNSVFSVGDCVVTQDKLTDGPVAWRFRGLPCAIKAKGDAQVFDTTNYKIGATESEPYKKGNRRRSEPILAVETPNFLYCDEVF